MAQIHAYLTFDGETREAMEFYHHCLGGDLEIQTVGESPMAEEVLAEAHDRVLHSSLRDGELVLMASDRLDHGGENRQLVKGNAVHLSLNCTSKEEIQTCFASLSRGGEVTMPLQEQFWGALFGMLTDQFGMHWMLNYELEQTGS